MVLAAVCESLALKNHNVSLSDAVLSAVLGSVAPLGGVTLAVSVRVPVAEELIVPVAV